MQFLVTDVYMMTPLGTALLAGGLLAFLVYALKAYMEIEREDKEAQLQAEARKHWEETTGKLADKGWF